MAEEPRPLMYEVGVEGDLFHPHRKDANCIDFGCVPVMRLADEATDAAIGRWLLARMQRESCHPNFDMSGAYGKYSLYLFDREADNLRAAVQAAMAQVRPPTSQEPSQ